MTLLVNQARVSCFRGFDVGWLPHIFLLAEMLYLVPCPWNFRTNHCMYGLTCLESREQGVKILHGKNEVFLNGKVPAFKAVYDTIRDYRFQQNYTRYIVKVSCIVQIPCDSNQSQEIACLFIFCRPTRI